MKIKGTHIFIASGVVLVAICSVVVFIGTGKPKLDTGGDSLSIVEGLPPQSKENSLDPVGDEEASRRATYNDEQAKDKNNKDSYVAKPVIAGVVDTTGSETKNAPKKGLTLPKISPINEDDVQNTTKASDINKDVVRDNIQDIKNNDRANKIQAQINQLLSNKDQGLVVFQNFKKPENQTKLANSSSTGGSAKLNVRQSPTILAARAGDIFFATLKIGFNSDDPKGLPVYATIIDGQDGRPAPLNGAVLAGRVSYTDKQAAVTFNEMTLKDGRTAQISAMAVTLTDGRTGIAEDVNNHNVQRYSQLIAGSLLQGLGTAARDVISNRGKATYGDGYVTVDNNNKFKWDEVGVAALEPVGTNLNSAFSRNFNRPATISSAAGSEIGIVFTKPITIQ